MSGIHRKPVEKSHPPGMLLFLVVNVDANLVQKLRKELSHVKVEQARLLESLETLNTQNAQYAVD